MDGFFVAKFKKFANGVKQSEEEQEVPAEQQAAKSAKIEKDMKDKAALKKKKANLKKKLQKKAKKAAKKEQKAAAKKEENPEADK